MKTIKYVFIETHKDLRKNLIWTTANGDMCTLRHMEDSHLVNLVLYLNKKQEDLIRFKLPDVPFNDKPINEWLEILNNEIQYRELNDKYQ